MYPLVAYSHGLMARPWSGDKHSRYTEQYCYKRIHYQETHYQLTEFYCAECAQDLLYVNTRILLLDDGLVLRIAVKIKDCLYKCASIHIAEKYILDECAQYSCKKLYCQ